MARHLDGDITEIPARVPLTMELLKTTEIDEYLAFRNETDTAELYRRLNEGTCCFVARSEGPIVHAVWAARRRAWIDYLSCEIQLGPDAIYIYDSFTSPGFRGKNIAPFHANKILQYFRDAGYRHIFVAVLPENKAGLNALEKAGPRPFKIIGYVRIFFWRRYFLRVVGGCSNSPMDTVLQLASKKGDWTTCRAK